MTEAPAPAKLAAKAAAWNVRLEGPVAETPSGLVAFGRRQGSPVVIKLPSPAGDEMDAWAALAHYDGCGAVRLLDHRDGAHLLERAIPGTPLRALVLEGRDDEATAIICGVAARLHLTPPPESGFKTVEELGRGFARYRAMRDETIPAGLVDKAEKLYFALAASQGPRRLLHRDLHHYNILLDEDRGWLAIDPKGVIGEPAYDFGAMLWNPIEDRALFASASIAQRRVAIVSERLELPRDRLLGWGFAQAILSAVWSVEDGEDPSGGLALADAVRPLL